MSHELRTPLMGILGWTKLGIKPGHKPNSIATTTTTVLAVDALQRGSFTTGLRTLRRIPTTQVPSLGLAYFIPLSSNGPYYVSRELLAAARAGHLSTSLDHGRF